MTDKDATLKLPTDLVEGIIKQQIHVVIAQALADTGAFTKAVSDVLSMRVDSQGRLTTSSYDSQPFLQRSVGQAIADVTRQVITEEVAKMKDQIRAQLLADLKKKNSPLLNKLVESMGDALISAASDKWKLTVSVDK